MAAFFIAMPPSRPSIIATLDVLAGLLAIGAFIAFMAAIFAIGAAFIVAIFAIGAFFAFMAAIFAIGAAFIAAIFAIGAFFAPPRRPRTKGSIVSSSRSVPSLAGLIRSSIKNTTGWSEEALS